VTDPAPALDPPGRRAAALWRPALACFLLVLACHLWRVGAPPMAGTEAFRAIPAHEMVQSGDWRLPTIFGELYLTKPPGFPWMLAAAESLTGVADEWVWRSVSALASAALAALLAVMAGRWFGHTAAWASGLGYMTLIGLWAQSRTAEIDAAMTLACVACALCFVELGFGPRKRAWPWALAAALALAATLLIKFHQGLIVIGGAWLGATLANGPWPPAGQPGQPRWKKLLRYARACPWRWMGRPSFWLALVGGVALFGLWAFVAWRAIQELPHRPDLTGLDEAGSNTLNLEALARALLVPITLTAMSLPPAFALLLAPALCRRHDDEPPRRAALSRGLFGLIAASLLILVVNGVVNPRYGYIVLPFWALLAGRAADLWHRQRLPDATRTLARQLATGIVVGVPVGHLVVTAVAWPDSRQPIALLLAAAAALAVAFIGARLWIRQRLAHGALAIVAAFALLSIPVGDIKSQARWNRSAYRPAGEVRAIVRENPVGAEPRLIAFGMLRDKPELFWYAGLPVTARYHDHKADEGKPPIDRPGWYVLSWTEWRALRDRFPQAEVYDDLFPQGVLMRHAPAEAAASSEAGRGAVSSD